MARHSRRSSYSIAATLIIVSCATACASTTAAPPRNAYFGDLHLHTSYSFDAYIGRGNRVTPDEAYRFARGQPINIFGHTIQRGWPLDFLAVTDHSDNLGIGSTFEHPDSKLSRSLLGQQLKSVRNYDDIVPLVIRSYSLNIDPAATAAAWKEEIAAANRNYEPGKFTSLIAFEWVSKSIHRNIIFAGDNAPLPFTMLQSQRVEDLWTYMEAARAGGVDSITINNHPVGSHGEAFPLQDSIGSSLDANYAKRRARNERLTEIINTQAEHDSTPDLSPNDPHLGVRGPIRAAEPADTVRGGLGRGLALVDTLGTNPFQTGVVGSSDSHIGLTISGPASFKLSKTTSSQDDPIPWPMEFDILPGPLTGVWAEENTRPAIFAALKRREVFATSGPRIKVHFSSGWANHKTQTLMGGTLPKAPSRKVAPHFRIWAQGDPEGPELSLAQVIKLTYAGDRTHEQIFDVPTQRSKDKVLTALWQDPLFDADEPALYYLRVLEPPTVRWTSIFGKYTRLNPKPDWIKTTQQRAWSSPIWHYGNNTPGN
jgi:hypothetical protein